MQKAWQPCRWMMLVAPDVSFAEGMQIGHSNTHQQHLLHHDANVYQKRCCTAMLPHLTCLFKHFAIICSPIMHVSVPLSLGGQWRSSNCPTAIKSSCAKASPCRGKQEDMSSQWHTGNDWQNLRCQMAFLASIIMSQDLFATLTEPHRRNINSRHDLLTFKLKLMG